MSHQCEYCNKSYSTGFNLNKHQKKCKDKIIIEQRKMIEAFKGRSTSVTDGTTINADTINGNINVDQSVTINLVSYGEEDLSFLSQKLDLLLNNKNYKRITSNIFKLVHCSASIPSQNNVYKKYENGDKGLAYIDGEWVEENINELVDMGFDQGLNYVEDVFKRISYGALDGKTIPQKIRIHMLNLINKRRDERGDPPLIDWAENNRRDTSQADTKKEKKLIHQLAFRNRNVCKRTIKKINNQNAVLN